MSCQRHHGNPLTRLNVLQNVPRAFSLVTQHFPRTLKHLRANPPPNRWASGVSQPPLGPAARGGTEWEGIQCPMSRFCGTLFGHFEARLRATSSAAKEWDLIRQRLLTGPTQCPFPVLAGAVTRNSSRTLRSPQLVRDCVPCQKGSSSTERPHKSRKSSPVPRPFLYHAGWRQGQGADSQGASRCAY